MGLFKKNKNGSNENTQDDMTKSEWTDHTQGNFEDTLSQDELKAMGTSIGELSELSQDDTEEVFPKTKSKLTGSKTPFSGAMKKVKDQKKITPKSESEFTGDYTGVDSETQEFEMPNDFTRPSVSDNEDSIFITRKNKNLNEKTTSSTDLMTGNGFDLEQKKLPIIGAWSIKSQYQLGIGVAVLGLAGLIAGIFLYNSATTQQNKAIQAATQFNGDAQKLDSYYTASVSGRPGAYENLLRISNEVQKDYMNIKTYNNNFSGSASSDIGSIQNKIDSDMSRITNNVNALKNQAEFLKTGNKTVTDISTEVAQLTDLIDRLGSSYSQTTTTAAESYNFFSLKSNLQSMNNEVTTLLLANSVPSDVVNKLEKNRADFKKALSQFYVGDQARGVTAINASQAAAYRDLTTNWVHFNSTLDAILTHGAGLSDIRALTPQTAAAFADLDQNISTLQDLYSSNDVASVNIARLLLLVSLIILVAATVIIFFIYNVERDNRSTLEKSEYSRNQSSILKLLNEMMPLQDGDLTQKTTVTEEITGAIADSINATIDSLASLVRKIKDTSFTMRQKTNEVNTISLQMLNANEKQASEISATSNSVIDISNAITDISVKTEAGAKVASNSVKVSEEGSQQVFASVEAMKVINEQMTETVHLMKKVSDSSKQIFEIVELLSDIAEETSILALNATVQAAKAGEAGKGFKIVADGIQELADGAGDATRRVGALIAAVQTDIQAVGEAVQKTTSEVERGVGLSELAGNSLNQMTEVSNNLAQIVRSISEDARKHAVIANQVSRNVSQILTATQENKEATQKTAASISEIAETANELGDSVQSFKVE